MHSAVEPDLTAAVMRVARALERIDARAEPEPVITRRDRPRRFGAIRALAGIPGALSMFDTEVPSEFWTFEDDGATVACPCGHEPAVPKGGLTSCECSRWFVFDGAQVRVWTEPDA